MRNVCCGARAPRLGSPRPGLQDPDGELSPGHAADIVLIPARSLLEDLLEATPTDLLYAVVHRARGPMVSDVLVEGQLVASDGASTLVDEHELNYEVERARSFWQDRFDLPAGVGGVWFPPPAPEARRAPGAHAGEPRPTPRRASRRAPEKPSSHGATKSLDHPCTPCPHGLLCVP